MVLEFLGLAIPTSVGDFVWLATQTFLIFIAIVIADKVLTHGVEAKHALILAVAAYFLPGVALFAVSLAGLVLPGIVLLVFPLIIWIILGEILLEGDLKDKLIVAVIGYAIFLIINAVPLRAIVSSFIPI